MKIILATDGTKFSDAAEAAVDYLALGAGDEILVINVLDMAVPSAVDIAGGYLPDAPSIEAAGREAATRIAEDTASRLSDKLSSRGVSISTDVLFGSPESRIVETAREQSADLIVIGSHGYNAIERLLLGSVSDAVVRHAPCSVLLVRQPHA